MSFVLRSLLIFTTITCSVYELAEAQTIRRALSHIFCHKCRIYDCACAQPVTVAPMVACAVPAPTVCVPPPTQTVGAPVAQSCTKTCTTVRPVVETRYRQENYMTCRTECRTAYRQEAYCETVPTTCIENVTRDEGCYQMVWVPKPVTRQVAKTVYQQRTAYRTVPYQYTVQVPQMNTRVVPEQTVRYVQQTQTFVEPMQPLGCAVPAPLTCAAPVCAAPEGFPAPLTSLQTEHSGTPWTTVPQRAAAPADVQGANYMQVSNTVPTPAQVPQTPTAVAPVQIPGTPTAAAVWQSQR